MKQSLLLLCMLAAAFLASAKDNLKVRCVSDVDHRPVANAVLSVEYPDTIMIYQTDRKGKAHFIPSSYPLTVTARARGMLDSTVGLMSQPDKMILIGLTPDPAATQSVSQPRRIHWSSCRKSRLSSVYVVRGSDPKTR